MINQARVSGNQTITNVVLKRPCTQLRVILIVLHDYAEFLA